MDWAIVLRAGVTYFAWVFAAGFLLGSIRIGLVVPHVGARIAELLEMPIMLGVIYWAAGWVVRRFGVPAATMVRLQIGILALSLMLLFEFAIVLPLRGLTFSQYLHTRDPIAAIAYALSLGVFALMPWLVGKIRCLSQGVS